jgi:transcription initiation factor TFIIIB Brf1 subunit/transcription initiation factor TFIIB
MKCPYCGRNPVIVDPSGILICIHCGGVVEEKPIDDHPPDYYDEQELKPFSGTFTFLRHDKGVGSTNPVSVRDLDIKLKRKEKIEACLRILWKYYRVVFRDECTLNESARLLHLAIDPDDAKTPVTKLDELVGVVVLIASRRCGREIPLSQLNRGFNEITVQTIGKILEKYPALKKYYTKPNTRELVKAEVIKTVKCLEEAGKIPSEIAGKTIEKAIELLEKMPAVNSPKSTAGALVYLASNTLGNHIIQKETAECTGVKQGAVENMVKKIKSIIMKLL